MPGSGSFLVVGFGTLLLDYSDSWAVSAAFQYAKCGERLEFTSLARGFEPREL